jgi:hypothetical protein
MRNCFEGMDLWSILISFLPLFFLGFLFFFVGTDVVNQTDLHGLSTGYFDANCTAEDDAGIETVYCVGAKCKSKILCCDYPVSIIPDLPSDPSVIPFLNGSKRFSEFLTRRACGYPNPCTVFRGSLGKDADPTFFSCKFSPEKLTSPAAASKYCPDPNTGEYFGSCTVVSSDEFDILQDADDLRESSRPFFYIMQVGGALILLISFVYGATATCCFCLNSKNTAQEAVTPEQMTSDAPYHAFS